MDIWCGIKVPIETYRCEQHPSKKTAPTTWSSQGCPCNSILEYVHNRNDKTDVRCSAPVNLVFDLLDDKQLAASCPMKLPASLNGQIELPRFAGFPDALRQAHVSRHTS